jgi:hypothetical protein
MHNSYYLDGLTPGMRAKLDPTYRRKTQSSEPAGTFRMTQETAKYCRPSLLPFTANNKVSRVTDRLI